MASPTWVDDLTPSAVIWKGRLSSSSASLAVGDWFCIEPSDATGLTATKVTEAALAAAATPLGIAKAATLPGGDVVGYIGGYVPAAITGLGAGDQSAVKVNTSTARSERAASPASDDSLVGYCDTSGGLTNISLPAPVNAASGNAIVGLPYADPRHSGALDPSGVTDGNTTLQNAATSASNNGTTLWFPQAHYRTDAPITFSNSARVIWQTSPGVTLDFSNISSLSARKSLIQIGTHNVTAAGPDGVTAIALLAVNATRGDVTVTLDTNVAALLEPGDIILIHDSDDYSWNPNIDGTGGHNDRPYYHAGEQLVVDSVSGTDITFTTCLRGSYTAGPTIGIYKKTENRVQIYGGGKIICPGLASLDTGIHIQNGTGKIEGIEIIGPRWTAFEIWRGRGLELVNCKSSTFDLGGIDEGIGVLMLSSEDCWVRGGSFRSGKHGMTMTGGAVYASIPNRRCGAEGATLVGSLTAADQHGHNEDCSYKNCEIVGGCSLGGRNATLSGGTVHSASDLYNAGALKGLLLRTREVRDGIFTVENVKFKLDHLSPQSGSDYPISLDTFDAIGGGKLIMRGCSIEASVHNNKLGYASAWAGSSGDFELVVDRIEYEGVVGQKPPTFTIACVDSEGDAAFDAIELGSMKDVAVVTDNLRFRRLKYRNVTADSAEAFGLTATAVEYPGVSPVIELIGCRGNGCDAAGIYIDGGSASYGVRAVVRDCEATNNGQDAGVSNASKTGLRAENLASLDIRDNDWGDTQGSPTQTTLYRVNNVTTLTGCDSRDVNPAAGLLRSVDGSVTNDLETYAAPPDVALWVMTYPPSGGAALLGYTYGQIAAAAYSGAPAVNLSWTVGSASFFALLANQTLVVSDGSSDYWFLVPREMQQTRRLDLTKLRKLPTGSGGGTGGDSTAVQFSNGDVILLDNKGTRYTLSQLNAGWSTGSKLIDFTTSGAGDVHVDKDDNLWVQRYGADSLHRYTAATVNAAGTATADKIASGSNFNGISGFAFDAALGVWHTSYDDNVIRYHNAAAVTALNGVSSNPAATKTITGLTGGLEGVALDKDGNAYVGAYDAGKVYYLTAAQLTAGGAQAATRTLTLPSGYTLNGLRLTAGHALYLR